MESLNIMGPRQTANQKDFPAILKYISQTGFQIPFPFASLEKVERRKANSASSVSFSFLKGTTSLISSPIEDFSENLQPKFSPDAQIEFLSDGIDVMARLGGRGASFHLVRIYHSASSLKSPPSQISIFQISNTYTYMISIHICMFHKLCKAVISSPYCPVVFWPWSDALWATCRVPDYHKHQNNLRYKWYETSNSKIWLKEAKPKGKKLFYVIMDRIGQKEPRMCDPFIVHTLILPNILRKIADHKMLTPVLFAATWRAPQDGFHLKVLGTEGGRDCPSVGRPPTTRRAGSTMSSKL